MQPLWLAERVGGLMSLVLLTVVVLLGIAVSAQWRTKYLTEARISGLHRWLSLVIIVFLAIHVVSTVTDSYVSVEWLAILVPFTSTYKTNWVAIGTLAFDLLIALLITSYLRTKIGRKAWVVIHRLTYLCWGFATIHALGGSSEISLTYALALTGVVLVAVAAVMRFVRPPAVIVEGHPKGLPGITSAGE